MSLKKKAAVAAASVATLAGITLGTAANANATIYYNLHAWYDYSAASATSTAGEWTQSWALHGPYYARSGWANYKTSAWADAGWSGNYAAGVNF